MRFLIKTTPNTEIVPYNYQQKLLGVFHKWLGEENPLHDAISLYSYSWLECAEQNEAGFTFPKGSIWTISFWDAENLKAVLNGISINNELFCGMKVEEVVFDFEPQFKDGVRRFLIQSPLLIKKPRENAPPEFLITHSEEADRILTHIMSKKLEAAGIDEAVTIQLDRDYQAIKTKLVSINNIDNKAFFCPVIITGSNRVIQFARTVGIGHSTGSGFGFIK